MNPALSSEERLLAENAKLRAQLKDAEERRKHDVELADREAHLRRVIDNQLGLVGLIDRKGVLLEVDQRSLAIARSRREQVIGKHFADAPWWSYDPAVAGRMRDAMSRAFAGEVVRYDVSLFAHGDDGVLIDFMIAPVFGADGEVEYLIPSGVDIRERYVTELKLRDSEARFRVMADNIPQMAWIVDAGTEGISWFNKVWLGYTGATLEQMQGSGWKAVHHPEYVDRVVQKFEHHVQEGLDWEDTFPLRGKDGQYRWFLSRMTVIRDEAGAVVSLFGTNTDITEQRKLAEDLRKSEERFRVLATAMPQLVWTCSSEGKCTFMGPQWEIVTGQSCAEAQGNGWLEMIHPDDRAPSGESWQVSVAEARTYEAEYRLWTQAGAYRWFLARGERLTEAPGEEQDWIGTSTDIDDAKRTATLLNENEQRMRLATEATAVGIWEWNVLTDVMRWDAQLFRIYGIPQTPDGLVHYSDWSGAVLPEDLPENKRILQDTIQRCGQSRREFRILRRNDGECRFIAAVETVRTNERGQAEWVVGTNLDITESKLAEYELRTAKEVAETANAAKDRFLAMLSHELRTPLTPVLMAVGALEHEPALSAEVRDCLAMIKRNLKLEIKLIDDLLDLNRIQSGKVVLEIAPVDLNEALRHVCDICRPDLGANDIRLKTVFDANAGLVAADAARLQQIFWNVLRNAIKFTPKDGVIHVATKRLDAANCEVRVEDSGMGIPPELLPRIFDAFEQGGPSVTQRFGGLGLGLAICKALITLQQGTIRAESSGDGKGATFIIKFPVATSLLKSTDAETLASGTLRSRQLRILLVEDHPDTVLLLSMLLQKAGHAVVTAVDVASALATLERESFDVLISDLGLPDGSGLDVMRELRSRSSIPAIAMSGYGMEEDVRRSREAGFNEHLVKPVDPEDLKEAIRRVTESRNR